MGDGNTGQKGRVVVPVAVAGGHRFSAIAAGGVHSCGLDTAARAWCWGWNNSGQLGDGGADPQWREFAPVAVAGDHRFSALATGRVHSCGLDIAGLAWCWGRDPAGQLGDGPPGRQAGVFAPVAVAGSRRFTALAAGAFHTCGLDNAGRAWCWGRDVAGQAGDGDTDQKGRVLAPVAVAGSRRFTALAAGGAHSCGVDVAGRAWCWGRDAAGQIGDGDTEQTGRVYAPVAVAPGPASETP